jgi:hypothetical protein
MSRSPGKPSDPDLQGVPAALRRATAKARELAMTTGTPFISRRSSDNAASPANTGAAAGARAVKSKR